MDMHMDDLDSPWDDHVPADSGVADADWNRISSNFTNAGYREGITAGKERALQEGFDSGFSDVGAPLGRQLGALRGRAAAVLAFLSAQTHPSRDDHITAAREIASKLAAVRFSDVVPPDLEAEQHAREHLEAYTGPADADVEPAENEELKDKRAMENLEDMLASMSADSKTTSRRLGPADVRVLEEQLDALCKRLFAPSS